MERTKLDMGWMLGKNKERGFIIVASYLLMASVLTLVFAFFFRSFNNFRASNNRLDQIKAQYAAETGIERAIYYFRATYPSSAPNLQSVCQSPSSHWDIFSSPQTLDTATYLVRVTADCLRPKRVFWITSTATQRRTGSTNTVGAIVKQVRASVMYQPIGAYGSVINRFDPGTYLTAANYFFGPLHVNGDMQIYGKPWFGNAAYKASPYSFDNGSTVSTSTSALKYLGCTTADDGVTPVGTLQTGNLYLCSGAPDVNYGYYNFQLNRPRVTFPSNATSWVYYNIRTKSGITNLGSSKSYIQLAENGYYKSGLPITPTNPGSFNPYTPPLTGFYGATSGVSVVLRGVVKTTSPFKPTLIVAAYQDVEIDGDITYDCGGTTCTTSNTILGVIAGRNIIIRNQGVAYTDPSTGEPRITPAPKRIDGVYVALGGSIYFEGSAGTTRIFSVNGALTMEKAEGLHSLTTVSPATLHPFRTVSGDGRIVYVSHDPRLNSVFPNYFPYSLSVLSWEVCNGTCPAITASDYVTAETYPPTAVTFPLLTDANSPPIGEYAPIE